MRALAGISSAKIIFTQSRVMLLAFAWIAALFAIIFGDAVSDITRVGAICLLCFAAIVAPALRWDSLVILAGLAALVWMIHGAMPSFENWLRGTETVLVFAALLPTMALVRATAMTMPSVHDTQERLAGLPSKTSAGAKRQLRQPFGGWSVRPHGRLFLSPLRLARILLHHTMLGRRLGLGRSQPYYFL